MNDLVEMYAARRTVRSAVERLEPRALIVSSTTAAMLLPSLPIPYAVRFDAPARLNRTGARNAFLPVLERRAMRRARVTVPLSVAGAEALPEGAARPIVVSAPIDPSSDSPPDEREPLAVAYVPDPKAKGLEIVVGAWADAAVEGARLAVYGLDPEWALAHLRRTGTPRPGLARAAGHGSGRRVPRSAAPRTRVRARRPLGGLGPGAPRGARRRRAARHRSGGRALRGAAARRQLDDRLVADRMDAAALAGAIRAAFELPDESAGAYRERAAELLRPYRSEAVQRVVADELLPALLAEGRPYTRLS